MSQLVTVYTNMNAIKIHLVKNLLESEGITCFTKDELITQTGPYITGITNGIHLQVGSEDIAKAIEILQNGGYMQPIEHKKPSKWPTVIFIIVLIFSLIYLFVKYNKK